MFQFILIHDPTNCILEITLNSDCLIVPACIFPKIKYYKQVICICNLDE